MYRERVVAKTSGRAQAPIRFEAAPSEHVLITGADRLTGWRKADDARRIYSVAWPHKFIGWNRSMTHPDDEYHRIIGRCEQVAVNGYLLRQVLNAGQLAPGTFFVDVTNKTLLAWDTTSRDLNQADVEASVRQEVFRVEGDHVQLSGLRFRYAANMAQHGAVVLAGRHDTMEDCVIESMNSSGAAFTGQDAVVRHCVFRDNGQLGFGASRAHRLLFTECLVENNNTKGFDRGWEAGGDKLVLCRDAVVERSRFVRNRGNGIWFDIGNTNCTVRQCLIAENEDAGIFYEISFSLLAHDNVIVGNREGFAFREQSRTTPTIDDRASRPVWNHDELIRHNLIVFNRDAQVWGWFDVKDNRHWPARSGSTNQTGGVVATKPGNIAAADVADSKGPPLGLALEKLRLRFANNVYFAAPGQSWFKWGPTWARHQSYAGLSEFQSSLGLDADGQVLDPGFTGARLLDFRLHTEAMSLLKESYPRGPVPGALLGVRE